MTKPVLKLPLYVSRTGDMIMEADKGIVATVYEGHAAEIVKRLNAFEPMREALRSARQTIRALRGTMDADEWKEDWQNFPETQRKVEEALALAEKGAL